jgi:hypothetical protein
MDKSRKLAAVIGGLALALPAAALAHHGWTSYGENNSEVSGVVEDANLGGPHGLLKVRNAQGVWDVMLSPPFGIERAGLTLADIPKGTRVTARGHRHTDPKRLEIKTERLVVGAKTFNLYPQRD